MICILGDIHFNSSKDYYRSICESFLSWFDSWEYNSPDNTLILAGDLVESATNAGIVVSWLSRLLSQSRFDAIHICVGNHDKKIISGTPQLAYEYYKQVDRVFVHEVLEDSIIEGTRVLFLPYYAGVNSLGLTMKEYYSTVYTQLHDHYGLVVGHVGGEDALPDTSSDCIPNLGKINADRLCLGHIHTRAANPDVYIGSVYACKKNENDSSRAAWIFNPLVNEWKEDRLPMFAEFVTATYPEDLPPSNSLNPIYTILKCSSKKLAVDRYGDVWLRGVVGADCDVKLKNTSITSAVSTQNLSIKELFEEFASSQPTPLAPDVIQKCKVILGEKAS